LDRRNWTEPEVVAAIELYLRTPFGKIDQRNPEIVDLARRLDRTSGAVALKMANLASLDTTLDRQGMANASALDRRVWADFMQDIDRYVERAGGSPSPGFAEGLQARFVSDAGREGIDAVSLAKRRVGQDFFRRMIVASYDESCALSGITDRRLLVASHIARWADDMARRLDPTNGICLNPLLDRAFDSGLIAFGDDLRVLLPGEAEGRLRDYLRERCAPGLRLPSRFLPDRALIRAHRQKWNREFAPLA
jgi:putative restriction endonuclease